MKKTLEQIQREIEESRLRKINEERSRIQEENKKRDDARSKWIKEMRINEELSSPISLPSPGAGGTLKQTNSEPDIDFEISIIDFVPTMFAPMFSITINIIGPNSPEVVERGVVYGLNPDPSVEDVNVYTEADASGGLGEFTLNNVIVSDFYFEEVFIRGYIILSDETIIHSPSGLSPSISFIPEICLAEGTKIKLSNKRSKNIEDIEYTDNLLVWDFDLGKFSSSKPLWIKRKETTKKYNLLKFSDGTELRTISQHRIFNKEVGKFTYPMTDDTPIGTTTFNMNGEEVKLESKEVIDDVINYYNIITEKHINMFANGILTSCRYNNIYPIESMKFIKDGRKLKNREDFNVSDKFYNGLRIGEQEFSPIEVEKYVSRLESTSVEIAHIENL